MANELSLIGQMIFAKSPLPTKTVGSSTAVFVDVAGNIWYDNILSVTAVIATDNTPLVYGDITAAAGGYAYFENLDAAQTITLQTQTGPGATSTSDDFAVLGPGQWAILPLPVGQSMGAYASGGTPNLRYVLIEA